MRVQNGLLMQYFQSRQMQQIAQYFSVFIQGDLIHHSLIAKRSTIANPQ
ncbi:MAG: hypothetical protein WBV73_08600 [Phormidium sp.]